jgi:hypothetical protein
MLPGKRMISNLIYQVSYFLMVAFIHGAETREKRQLFPIHLNALFRNFLKIPRPRRRLGLWFYQSLSC